MSDRLHEQHESLWWLAAAPLIWAAHLLGSYCTAAIYCQKLGGSLGAVRLAIAGYSVLALAALIALGVRSYRRQRYNDTTGTGHRDTPEDRHRFLGFATMLLAGIAAVAVVYQALPFHRELSLMRTLFSAAGLVILGCVWLGPLHALSPGPFAAHMTMHMAVVAVAAPLLAFAVAGSTSDPVRRWPWLFPPLSASVAELIAVWAWHAPGPHAWARHSHIGLVLEQLTFLGTGLWLWLAAFGGDPLQRAERGARGGVALLLTSMHMTLLGALLALPPRPLYPQHAGQHALSALEDQHLGGAIMLVIGSCVYLAGGLVAAARLLRPWHQERMP